MRWQKVVYHHAGNMHLVSAEPSQLPLQIPAVQRLDARPGLAVRGTFSPARAWRPAVVARLARTLEIQVDWWIDVN